MATPEGKVKDAVKKRLEEYGVLPFIKAADAVGRDVVGMYWMPGQGAYSVQGVHDFVGCWDGVFFSLETKSEDNPVDATPGQEAFKVATLRCGGISFVGVRSADAVDRLADLIKDRRGT
jgi:hypothetical protein